MALIPWPQDCDDFEAHARIYEEEALGYDIRRSLICNSTLYELYEFARILDSINQMLHQSLRNMYKT